MAKHVADLSDSNHAYIFVCACVSGVIQVVICMQQFHSCTLLSIVPSLYVSVRLMIEFRLATTMGQGPAQHLLVIHAENFDCWCSHQLLLSKSSLVLHILLKKATALILYRIVYAQRHSINSSLPDVACILLCRLSEVWTCCWEPDFSLLQIKSSNCLRRNLLCIWAVSTLGKGLQHLIRFLSIHLAFPHDISCAMSINVFSLPLQGWAVCDMFESTDLALQAFYMVEVSERIIKTDGSCVKTVAGMIRMIRQNALVFGLFLYHWIMGTLFQWWRLYTQNREVQNWDSQQMSFLFVSETTVCTPYCTV